MTNVKLCDCATVPFIPFIIKVQFMSIPKILNSKIENPNAVLTYFHDPPHLWTSQAGKKRLKCAAKCTSKPAHFAPPETDFPFNQSWGASTQCKPEGSQLFWLPPGGLSG